MNSLNSFKMPFLKRIQWRKCNYWI